jgi:hypothetical protein
LYPEKSDYVNILMLVYTTVLHENPKSLSNDVHNFSDNTWIFREFYVSIVHIDVKGRHITISDNKNLTNNISFPAIFRFFNQIRLVPSIEIVTLRVKINQNPTCMCSAMCCRSDNSSDIFLVPKTFLSVVAANSLVEYNAWATLHVDKTGSNILANTTASTVTVRESFVKICKWLNTVRNTRCDYLHCIALQILRKQPQIRRVPSEW